MSPTPFSLILLAVFLTFACGRDSNKMPEPVRLEGVRILDSQLGIMDLEQIDSLLIVSTMQEPLFRVFSKTGAYLGGFGRIGNGPGEFPNPMYNFFADVILSHDDILFMVMNGQTNTMVLVNVGASLASGATVIHKEYALPRELSGAWGPNVNQINDSLLIGMVEDRLTKRLDEKRGYFYFHSNERRFDLLPLLNLSLDGNDLYGSININARGAHITPDRSKVVMPYVYVPLIDILDVNSKKITTIKTSDVVYKTTFSLDEFNNDTLIEYFRLVYTTNDRFYASYSGEKPSDEQNILIREYDWKGKVLNQYVMGKEFAVGQFIVDEANSTIYGISYELDAIYKFTF